MESGLTPTSSQKNWTSKGGHVTTMKRIRHTYVAEGFSEGVQIIRKLKIAEHLLAQGKTVADVC